MTKKQFMQVTGLNLIPFCKGEFLVLPFGETDEVNGSVGELRYERASEDWWEGNYHVTGSWMCTFTYRGIYVCEEDWTQKDCLRKAAARYNDLLIATQMIG